VTVEISEVSDPGPLLAVLDPGPCGAANDEAPAICLAPSRAVIEIGRSEQGATQIDLGRLLKTRLLIQAGSGGGKSWCLRRFIEQSYGKVRMIVFDPEGELVTLADEFDFTVCSPDSETNPIYADGGAAAARAIYLSGRSTILSMSEFDGLEQMQLFVAEFCRELLRMPASSWHHLVLVFDEAQLFAPQQDKATSKKPLVDLTRRGRKRGMCPVIATQRLSELSKGVASHLENKMIGLTSLELDIASAAKMLGMRPAIARQQLRRLPNGRFVCFGPALSFDLVETTVGPVSTRHGSLEEYRGVAQPPAMSSEALGDLLKSTNPSPVRAARFAAGGAGENQVQAGPHGGSTASAPRARTLTKSRQGRRSSANLARSFDVASQIVHGRQIDEIAREHLVTDQSVRNWLHAAVGRIDLDGFGIAADPLRVEDLRHNRHRVDTALRRARLNTF
jgi:hypothetical protein